MLQYQKCHSPFQGEPSSILVTLRDTDTPSVVQDVNNCNWVHRFAEATQECRRRIESELDKTSEGQERLGRAKERLDTRAAEIGQSIIDNENAGDVDVQEAPQNDIEENAEEGDNIPEGTGGDEQMDQQAPDSSTPMESSATEHFDMSPRTTSNRQAEKDDMDDDSPDKRWRPRSPTVSYRTDADSDGMDDGTLSGLNEIDRKFDLRRSWVSTSLKSSCLREWHK
jgi:hypothetical protein